MYVSFNCRPYIANPRKIRRQWLVKTAPIFLAEALEPRRLLSGNNPSQVAITTGPADVVTGDALGGQAGDANLTAAASGTIPAFSQPPIAGNWTSVFNDNFSGTALDSSWSNEMWGTTYTGGAAVANGTLQLTAANASTEELINTENSAAPFSFTYGYAQVTAQVPAGQGIWPGFWMMPLQSDSPTGSAGEIDVYEGQGNEPDIDFTTYHWGGHGQQLPANNANNTGVNLSQGYHTYGVDWEPTGITWYLDGTAIGSQVTTALAPIDPDPMYLILDVWLGGWNGVPNASTPFPATMNVLNVQVWQETNPAPAAKLVFTTQPPALVDVGNIMTSVVVAITDAYGNIVTSDDSNVTLSLPSDPGVLSGTTTVAAVNGVAVFSDLTVSQSGDGYRLQAADYADELRPVTSNSFATVVDWIDPASAATWDAGTNTLTVSGDAWIIGNPGGANVVNNGRLEIDANGTIGNLTGNGSLAIGNSSTGSLVGNSSAAIDATLTLNQLATANSVTDVEGSLTINPGSTLDITDNTLLLDYGSGSSPLAAVRAYVANGAIISSTANAGNPGQFAVGYADATELGSIPTGNVEIMFTLSGDANLDGTVNFNDFSIMQNNYDQSDKDWSQGDWNHDGNVNFNDFSLLQNNYDQSIAGTFFSAAASGATETVYGVYSPTSQTQMFTNNLIEPDTDTAVYA